MKESLNGYFVYEPRDDGWNDCFSVEDDDGMPFVVDKLKKFHGRLVSITIEELNDTPDEAIGTRQHRNEQREAFLADPKYAETLRVVESLKRLRDGFLTPARQEPER